MHLTGSLGGRLEREKSKRTDFRGVKQQHPRGAAGVEEENLRGRLGVGPEGRSKRRRALLSTELFCSALFLDVMSTCLPCLLKAASDVKAKAKFMRAFAMIPSSWSKLLKWSLILI